MDLARIRRGLCTIEHEYVGTYVERHENSVDSTGASTGAC